MAKGGVWFIVFAAVTLLHSAVWASYIGMYYELVRTGAMSVIHFASLFMAFAFAVAGSVRVLFRSRPPVLAFALASLFGLVALRNPLLVFEVVALALAVIGTIASLTLRSLASSESKGFRAEV